MRSFAAYAWQNDERLARLTGQPFSESIVLWFWGMPAQFDSAPATLVWCAVGSRTGREREALKALQHARFV